MIVIAILAIPFIFYFVRTPDYGAMGRSELGKIYGRKLTQMEIDRNARLGGLAQAIGMSDFWETLSLRQPGNNGYGTFALNLIVLRHEADRLGLRPSGPEVADVVRKLPAFQGEDRTQPLPLGIIRNPGPDEGARHREKHFRRKIQPF